MNEAGAALRAQAALTLHAVYSGRSLREAMMPRRANLVDPRDRALLTAMVRAAVRRAFFYRALRRRLLSQPLPRKQAVVEALIDIGIAQIDVLELPSHAAVAATVGATRVLGHARLAGLVNAVLRRYQRERSHFDDALRGDAEATSEHPAWLHQRLVADWGQAADAIMKANLQPPPLWLRVNPLRGSREAYAERLAAAGFTAETSTGLEQALKLSAGVDPTTLPGFSAGQVSVQDGGAQWAARLLDAQPGEHVLDACAAPGGKTAHVLERAAGDLIVLALDSDPERLDYVRETLARLGLSATVQMADAGDPGPWWDHHPFDRILLDAPCSGSGVIRRHPDIRLHRRAADLPVLVAAQARLLEALWPMLRPGGRLVYVTCSVLRDENDRQIDAFLAHHADAHAVDPLPADVGRRLGVGRQILPGEHAMDGFFLAAIDKRLVAASTGGLR